MTEDKIISEKEKINWKELHEKSKKILDKLKKKDTQN